MTTTADTTHPAYDRTQCPVWCTAPHAWELHAEDQYHRGVLAETDAGIVELIQDTRGKRTVFVEVSWSRELANPTPDQLREVVRTQHAFCERAADAMTRAL